MVKAKANLADKVDEIKAWLINTGESDLIFSFQPDKKYIAQVVNMIDFKQVLKYTSRFPIFKVGKNVVSFSENVSKVEVWVNEVWI